MTHPPRRFSLAALTVLGLSPPEMVSAAAAAGYQHVGLRLIPATPDDYSYPVIGDTPMVRDIRERLDGEGVSVLDVEVFRLKPDTGVADFLPAIETAASLGARCLLATGQDGDAARLADRFAALCALAGRYQLTVDLEFMPWTEVNSLASALRVLGRAGCGNGGLLVDALHFNRTGTGLDALAGVPRERLHFAQLCDAPAARPPTLEAILHEARNARLLPGQGGLDLAALLRALPRDLPISVEVPNADKAGVTPVAHARAALEAARRVAAQADALPGSPG